MELSILKNKSVKYLHSLLTSICIFLWLKLSYDLLIWENPADWYSYASETFLAIGVISIFIAASLFFLLLLGQFQEKLYLTNKQHFIILGFALGSIIVCTNLDSIFKTFQFACIPVFIYFIWLSKNINTSFVLLILLMLFLSPGDRCWNPPNTWYINNIGLSPLQFLPFVTVCLFLFKKIRYENVKSYLLLIFTLIYLLITAFHFFSGGWTIFELQKNITSEMRKESKSA